MYKYTDAEKKELLKSLNILCDTREKRNEHIIEYFDKNHILWKKKALSNGDYSFFVPKNEKLNIDRDMYFDNQIVIERKNSLDELAGNLGINRARFEKELATTQAKKYLMIENASYADIKKHNYQSEYAPKSFIGTLHTFNHRYNLEIMFMPDIEYSGLWIRQIFTYWLREMIK